MSERHEFTCDVCGRKTRGYDDCGQIYPSIDSGGTWVRVELKVGAIHQLADLCEPCTAKLYELIPAFDYKARRPKP